MTVEQIKLSIKEALQSFAKGNLTEKSLNLFENLGYVTERRAPLHKPTYAEFKDTYIGDKKFDEAKTKTSEWKYVDLLFQLSKEEVLKQATLFDTKQVERTVIETYLFFTIELSADEYSRTELSIITREINRLFPMPAMILFKHGKTLTLSVINRRLHKRDDNKDVLEKVTLIKDIVIENPHRAHIEILFDLTFDELKSKHQFTNFVELHNAWQKTLDTKELNKRFYSELFNWYLWAVRSVNFPNDVNDDKDDMVYNSESVIRLLTRLIFVWFIKEKNLVPDSLFEIKKLKDILNDFKPQSEKTSVYYRAILQNLFFATLNTPMDKDITAENKDEQRRFINTLPKTGNDQYLDQTKYRYQNYFTKPDKALELFSSIPFLNGGLFECLDFKEGNKEIRFDGFSSTEKRQAFVPDKLFFADEFILDLNSEYGTKGKKYKVEGLINILDGYKFTITENTPLEEEIALDPELLGKVFENLLASYNPETQTTARKQTGSFYTPREIVNYMVDESLIAYFQSIVSIPAHVDNEINLSNEFFNPDNEIYIHQGNLPHWQQQNVWYFITFRLADSIPAAVVEQIKKERELWLKKHDKINLTSEQKRDYYKLFSERTENLLNAGKGSCVLKDEKIAKIVSEALLHFNNQRYILDEWVIMPNHVHILVKPLEGHLLPEILHSWKSFTANEINKVTGNKGQLWMHESYDHIVRNEKALMALRRYIWDNPVKSGITLPSVCLSSNRSKDASDTFETKLRNLFSHTIDLPEFSKSETDVFIKAISEAKILDPACGSGAFPMGVLHRLVDLLNKLDPDNKKWNELQIQRAIDETTDVYRKENNSEERKLRLDEIEKAFDLSMNYPDYARKLFLIENCIYGVDIQQIAIQISKLRFFISLIVDQKVNDSKPNRNILSMPNLETKFVAANTLIGLDKPQQMTLMAGDVERLEKELGGIRRKIFFTRKYSAKKVLKKKEKTKREELQIALTQSGFSKNLAGQMAGWNPFDPMQSAKFFDPETMFGYKDGFDVVIGNPPFISYYARRSAKLDTATLRYYQANYDFITDTKLDGKFNSIMFFIERACKILSSNASTFFILDIAFNDVPYRYIRKYLLENSSIIKLLTGLSEFENVYSDQILLQFTNEPLEKRNNNLVHYYSNFKNAKLNYHEVEQKLWLSNKLFAFALPHDNNSEAIFIKIEKFASLHESFPSKLVRTCLSLAGHEDEFLLENNKSKRINPILNYIQNAKNLPERYSKILNPVQVVYDEELKDKLNQFYRKDAYNEIRRQPKALGLGSLFAFTHPKLFVRQSADRIIATYTDVDCAANTSFYIISEKDEDGIESKISLKYLLAILNSKLLSFYALEKKIIITGDKKQPQMMIKPFKTLPIATLPTKDQKSFVAIVDKILSAKEKNSKADTSELEKQIDKMVYKLYELTDDEIAIIENKN